MAADRQHPWEGSRHDPAAPLHRGPAPEGRTRLRQGRITLAPASRPAGDLERVKDRTGEVLRGVVFEGVGGSHRLLARVYRAEGKCLLFLERPTPLEHATLPPVEVPAGWWEPQVEKSCAC